MSGRKNAALEEAGEPKTAEVKKDSTKPCNEKEEGSKKGEERDQEHIEECATQASVEETTTNCKEKSIAKTSDKGSLNSGRPSKSDTSGKKSDKSLVNKDRRAIASARLKRLKAEAFSKKQELKKEDSKKERKDTVGASARKKFKSIRGTISRIAASKKEESRKSASKKERSRKSKVQEKVGAKPDKKNSKLAHASPKNAQRKKYVEPVPRVAIQVW
ncbi:hypothetical protein ANCDUO_01050 [Ancylostoma duodenale]|uniref:Uncharacterized protein n=1 Tax=Ancylostoma duodenale TaxID=51022 RepID=A0A0C2DZW9_9BILA|nr:hypothetical protein ANCDUO_01050 [Ancylostoma duodenale]